MDDDGLYRWLMGAGSITGDGLPTRPSWMLGALCLSADPEAFFPERGETPAAAKAICDRCDVRAACLEYALAIEDDPVGYTIRTGVWGGTDPKERERIARNRACEAA